MDIKKILAVTPLIGLAATVYVGVFWVSTIQLSLHHEAAWWTGPLIGNGVLLFMIWAVWGIEHMQRRKEDGRPDCL